VAGGGGCKRVVLAVSPRLLRGEGALDTVEAVERLERLGYAVSVAAVSDYRPEAVAARLAGECSPPECCVIVPGGVEYDYSGLAGVRVLKGTYTLRGLPLIVEAAGLEALSPSLPAEKALGPLMASVAESLLCTLSAEAPLIPERPPPVRVASEVYVDSFGSPEDALDEAELRLRMGADILVMATRSASPRSGEALERAVSAAVRRGLGPLGVDPADRGLLPRLARQADLLMSVEARDAGAATWAQGKYLVVLEPGGPEAMVRACRRLGRQGFKPVIDPVALPHPRALRAFADLLAARGLGLECPALIGINNVYELLDADTTGSIAVLTLMAAEAGASAVLVSEESGKSAGATAEAKAASVMAGYSLYTGAPPKDLGVNLLTVKCKEYRAPAGRGKLEAAEKGEKCLETLRRLARPWNC